MKDKKIGLRPPQPETAISILHNSQDLCQNSTTENERQGFVYCFLKKGRENAITTEKLCRLIGCSSVRQLRKYISDERAQGYLILSTKSGHGGYFLPADGKQGHEEIESFVAMLQAQSINTLAILRHARRALKANEDQLLVGGF